MASNMRITAPKITGKESLWGDIPPPPAETSLINASPTLLGQLQDYGNDVDSKKMQPMVLGNDDGTYLGPHSVVVGNDFKSKPADDHVSTISHELGHYENLKNDDKFSSRYAVNQRDPNAYNVSALTGTHREGEAVYNNWKVQQEILKNTATPNSPGTQIALATPKGTQEQLDAQHAGDVRAGKSDEQDRNQLIGIGMNAYVNGAPSTAPNKTYYQYYGPESGAPVPEPGAAPKVSFTINDDGDVTSMEERWQSGHVSTQNFKDGKIQSSQTVDTDGKVLSTATYTYNQQGGYSVDVKDGTGHETQRGEFNQDKSGTVSNYAPDDSRQATFFDTRNRNTEITRFDPKDEKTNDLFLDPDARKIVHQNLRTPDGGHTSVNYDSEGRPRVQTHFDPNGRPERTDEFDENGNEEHALVYKPDGSRQWAAFNSDGSQSGYGIDKDGNRSDYYSPAKGGASSKQSSEAPSSGNGQGSGQGNSQPNSQPNKSTSVPNEPWLPVSAATDPAPQGAYGKASNSSAPQPSANTAPNTGMQQPATGSEQSGFSAPPDGWQQDMGDATWASTPFAAGDQNAQDQAPQDYREPVWSASHNDLQQDATDESGMNAPSSVNSQGSPDETSNDTGRQDAPPTGNDNT